MSATLPLPLELTQPMELASLEDSLKGTFQVETRKYNPETQVRETPAGVPMIYNHGGSNCSQESESTSGLLVIDVTVDIQIDDNDF